ncbi:unnamed protein product [Caenorhabditis brenneri]
MQEAVGTPEKPDGVDDLQKEARNELAVHIPNVQEVILQYLPIVPRGLVIQKFPSLQQSTDNLSFNLNVLFIDLQFPEKISLSIEEADSGMKWKWQFRNNEVRRGTPENFRNAEIINTEGSALDFLVYMLRTIAAKACFVIHKTIVFGPIPPIALRKKLKTRSVLVREVEEIDSLDNYFNLMDLESLVAVKIDQVYPSGFDDFLNHPMVTLYGSIRLQRSAQKTTVRSENNGPLTP